MRPRRPVSTFGFNLRVARQRAGMNQTELAAVVGVSVGTVHGWESKGQEPSVSTAAAAAHALGVSLDWMVGLTSSEPADELWGRLRAMRGGLRETAAAMEQVMAELNGAIESGRR